VEHKIPSDWIKNLIECEVWTMMDDQPDAARVTDRIIWHLESVGLLRVERLGEAYDAQD